MDASSLGHGQLGLTNNIQYSVLTISVVAALYQCVQK